MPTLEAVTESHARRQKNLARRTAVRLARLWGQISGGRIALDWRDLVPEAVAVLSTSQATAAASAGIYVDDALEAQGVFAAAEGRVIPARFAGVASDGRPLDTLLYEPVISTLSAIHQGQSLARARAHGLMRLDVIGRTQVADAGRAAESTAIAARPKVTGYVRMLSLPSCSRCIILAGRRYRWNQGFLRHPRCDCRHIPVSEDTDDDIRTDPKKAFESLSPAEQERAFTKAGAQSIREGADISQVVNARRGMQTATVFGRTVKTTTEAAGRRLRLMPEQIFIEANGDRQEAIRLLRLHGYIR